MFPMETLIARISCYLHFFLHTYFTNIIDRIPSWKLFIEIEKQKKALGYRKRQKQHKKESNSSILSRKEKKKNLAKSCKVS